jgi:hypothetical protein
MTYCDQNPPPPKCEPFGIEAVLVCDNYSDFLAYTLPHNKNLFDRIVVVTSYEDKATQKLCEFHHVECLKTDLLESRKGLFCKAQAINVGLDALKKSDWVVHLDADIWLPPQTRILLQRAELDKSMLYGIDRFIVKGAEQWHDFIEKPQLQHECDSWVHLNAFPVGTRVMQAAGQGYVPIGFFQLWNPKGSGVSHYPGEHTDAGRTDVLFAQLWPRSKRAMLPEIVGYHLESIDSAFGLNWIGRKSAPFSAKQS